MFKKKLLLYWPSFASVSSCSATLRSVDLAFVAFETILHVLPWSDRCLASRRAPALPNYWLLLVGRDFNCPPNPILDKKGGLLIAFSRNERTHPNLVSQAREIEIFLDCKLAAPVGFRRGFGPRFRVHLSRHACSLLWLLSLFSTLWGFLWS